MRRRRSALAVVVAVALAAIVVVTAQGGGRELVRVTYDRGAAAAYADRWALGSDPRFWSSPDNDCADFVSQCLAAGGLRPSYEGGLEWHENGPDLPSVAWANCGAQKRFLLARSDLHSRYVARTTKTLPRDWAAGDIVYLGAVVDGTVEWQHVIICVGRDRGEWVYDSHTTAHRRQPLDTWYPAHFALIRFCHIAAAVSYTQAD